MAFDTRTSLHNHLKLKHMSGYVFFYIDNSQTHKDWMRVNHHRYGPDKVFELLRTKFNKDTTDNTL